MRWTAVLPFALLALLAAQLVPSAAHAQRKPSSQDTVSLKEQGAKKKKPTRTDDQNGVVSLKQQDADKKKPAKTDDQNGVVSLQDEKHEKAEDAKRRKKIEKLVEASKKKQKAAAEDKPKREAAAPTLVPFEKTKKK